MTTDLRALNLETIAVVNDDPDEAQSLGISIKTYGSSSVLFTSGFDNVDSFVNMIREKASGVLCDHRLSVRTDAKFSGAEAVAKCFGLKIPAILVSEYLNEDIYTTIRLFRRKVPVVIHRDNVTKQSIVEGFDNCLKEINNICPSYRKPRRAFVQIHRLTEDSGIKIVEAFVPQWNPLKAVCFPSSLLGDLDNDDVKSDTLFIANVNIGSRSADELFFDNFELAPEPDDNDGLA